MGGDDPSPAVLYRNIQSDPLPPPMPLLPLLPPIEGRGASVLGGSKDSATGEVGVDVSAIVPSAADTA